MNVSRSYLAGTLATVCMLLAASTTPVMAGGGMELGVLTCKQVGTRVNLIVHSTAQVACEFKSPDGKVERYKGETGVQFGVDLQWKASDVMAFTVLGATSVEPGKYGLAGKYFGAGASAAVAVGAGAGVLAGGSNKQFSLQPLALSGSTGVGAAGGVTYLYLEPAP
jgi:hypothetical protein